MTCAWEVPTTQPTRNLMLTNLQFLHYIFAFFFGAWPIVMLGAFRKSLKHLLYNMLVLWCALVGARVFMAFSSEPIVFDFLISEPLSTFLFLFVGLALITIRIVLPMLKDSFQKDSVSN